MFFDFPQILFSQQLHIFRGNITTLAGKSVDKTILFKFFVCTLSRNKANTEILGKSANGRQHFIFFQCTAYNLTFNLRIYLVVNRCSAFVVN